MSYIVSNHWAHLALVGIRRVPITGTTPSGEEYVMDTHGPLLMHLRCDCGTEFTIKKDEFPGRRLLRFCGRPECPHGPKPPKARRARNLADPGLMVSAFFPGSLATQVTEWARRNNVSFSEGLRQLAIKGLVADLVERD